jgi:hypothetical protein
LVHFHSYTVARPMTTRVMPQRCALIDVIQ